MTLIKYTLRLEDTIGINLASKVFILEIYLVAEPFIHFRVYSDYSLGDSAIKVPDLIKHCKDNNVPAVALSDQYNLFGSLEFAEDAAKAGVQPITATVIRVQYEQTGHKTYTGELLLIAKTNVGYSNLLKLSSYSYLKAKSPDEACIGYDDLINHLDGIVVLCGTNRSPVYEYMTRQSPQIAAEFIRNLKAKLGSNLYIELTRCMDKHEDELEKFLLDLAYQENVPLIATNPIHFLTLEMHNAHDAMLCIANARYIVEDERPKSNPNCYFKTPAEMAELFHDLPEAIANTEHLARRISFVLQGSPPKLPKYKEGLDEEVEIRKLSMEGLLKHIEMHNIIDKDAYISRLEYELNVICNMKFSGYFLIVSDFIKWSKANDIPVGPGRGSGAGSVVAWSLEITDLDPIKYGLLFERFLNPERVSMPDFDIDFCQDRRNEVIDYVKRKYGTDRVANIITFGKLQARAVLRDVGRVIQMHYNEIDKICKLVPNNPTHPITLKEAINLDKELQSLKNSDENIARLLKLSLQLEGMHRHASTHAAGIVISDEPIIEIVPLYKDPNGETVLQYSMKGAEKAGLIKFDFLGLRTLTVISWTCNLIHQHSKDFDIRRISIDDQKTYDMLSGGHTIGIFQFESAGMKEAIKKLKPDAIGDLIALGSLYRPGPMDNIPSYINRKHGLEEPDYIHPKLESALKETYGIIVYQEQVMEIARTLSGYSLGEADLLRRAMGKKIKSEMEAQRTAFIKGAVKNGIDAIQAEDIFNLVEKFASYGFNKSHAAAYAIISYQTAYLKANYPLELLVASLNLDIHDADKINMFCQEAKRLNLKVLPPDVNMSETTFTIQGEDIRYALGAIKGVGISSAEFIIAERANGGKFKNLFDFVERCAGHGLNKKLLESFIKAGVLDSLEQDYHRAEMSENVEMLLKHGYMTHEDKKHNQITLFDMMGDMAGVKPELTRHRPWSQNEIARQEFSVLGFYLSAHPLEKYGDKLDELGILESPMIELRASSKSIKARIAGVITSRKIRSSNRGKYAFIQMSDQYGLFEVCVFNEELLYAHDELLKVGTTLFIEAEVRKDDSGMRITCINIMSLDEAISTVNVHYKIFIRDSSVIQKLKRLFSEKGMRVKLYSRFDYGDVAFSSTKQLRIQYGEIDELQYMEGVDIEECVN